jgi:hypothetical protein
VIDGRMRMAKRDYEQSQYVELQSQNQGWSFRALVMATMRRADTDNLAALRQAFPDVHDELVARYNAPGGDLPTDGLLAQAWLEKAI